jgi:uncharacterized Zn finger protein (UPF0148 family)
MDCTWLDTRPVIAECSQCRSDVQTTVHVRGKVYCPTCRQTRRAASIGRAKLRARERKQAARAVTFVEPPHKTALSKPRHESVAGHRALWPTKQLEGPNLIVFPTPRYCAKVR